MTPNPFSGLLHSRKFWLAVIDAVAAVLGLWVGSYVEPKLAQLILATWAAFQPVLIVVIAAIAYEDKANVQASAKVEEAELYNKATFAQIEADANCDKPAASK